ncbi:hypothetical protein AB0C70_10805 [Streptomyces sp. NPDC048564]|uniref:hypothetical protein n=1 Tax=Streptomyces sp. NPDC048564 TaxID=3155760 RepID=UPI0034421D19
MAAWGYRLRNGPHGYGLVTKALHRLVFAAIVVQFAVGYLLDVDASGRGEAVGEVRARPTGGAVAEAGRTATTPSATTRCSRCT